MSLELRCSQKLDVYHTARHKMQTYIIRISDEEKCDGIIVLHFV